MRPALLRLAPLALAALTLGACGTVSEDVRGPRLTPIAYPAEPVAQPQSIVSNRNPRPQPASANSLWQTGARAFFNDQRASHVGDILTVQISIDDSAQVSNATTRTRASNTTGGVTSLGGFEANLQKVLPGAPDTGNLFEFGGESNSNGQGSVNRREKINLTIAAVVTGVMPNWNLVIQGRQEVRTNAEVRDLTVVGIVRPQDISSANTIRHSQIAEARISYGGRGDISRIQKSPAGQSLVERFSPF
jgi:flagellar L-ring protein precursor FlgH